MTAHTKGVLKVNVWDYPQADPPRRELVIENKTNRIAVLDWDQGKDNPYTIPEAEARANAALFVAAPALLSTLTRLTEKVERANAIQHSGGKVCAEDWGELYMLANEARATIAATEGRA